MSIFVTITGQKHYFGMLPFSVGGALQLRPEPDNLYDSSAISVYSPVYGKVGSVAQNAERRADGTVSASSLLPQIGDGTTAIVRFIAGEYILAEITK